MYNVYITFQAGLPRASPYRKRDCRTCDSPFFPLPYQDLSEVDDGP